MSSGGGGGGGSAGGAAGIAATIERLATLQNLVKRDPEAYREEFSLQHQHFLAELEILKLNPAGAADTFVALTNFLAHVTACYKAAMAAFPGQLVELLSAHGELMLPDVRRGIAQALVLLRNKGVIDAVPLHRLFFALFRIKDRQLRQLLHGHIVHDIRALNTGKRDEATNRAVQALIYGIMADHAASPAAAHRSLAVMVELYKRRVWTDAKTVNAIAAALTSPHSKLMTTALAFFLGAGSAGANEINDDDEDSDSGNEDGVDDAHVDAKTMRKAEKTHAHSKHTKKRARQTERLINGLKKHARKAAKAAGPVFPAIQLLHDPQGLAEKLFARLRGSGEKFEIRLQLMNLTSRLIGQHKLLLLPFYSFLTRYLRAHQAQVTQVLAFLVQSCHDLVPPDEVLPVLRALCANFINDGCTPEVLQLGLNAFREVIAHCPVVLEEAGMRDLVQDLVQYRKYRGKGVVASARAVLNLIRDIYPALLKKRDWGRAVATGEEGASAAARPTSYGYKLVASGVEGADLLALVLARKAQKRASAAAAAAAADDFDEDEDASDEDDDDDDDDDEDEMAVDGAGAGSSRRSDSVTASKKSRRSAASAAAAAAAAAAVTPADIAAVADDDEWAAVERARAVELRKANKPLPEAVKAGVKARKAARAAIRAKGAHAAAAAAGAGDASDDAEEIDELLEEDDGHGHHHDDDDGHGHAHKHGAGCGDDCGHEHGGSDDSDDDEEDGSNSDGDDDDDDDDDEDSDADEEAAPADVGVGKKRGRPGAAAAAAPAATPAGRGRAAAAAAAKAGAKGKAAAGAAGGPGSKRRRLEPVAEASDDDEDEDAEDEDEEASDDDDEDGDSDAEADSDDEDDEDEDADAEEEEEEHGDDARSHGSRPSMAMSSGTRASSAAAAGGVVSGRAAVATALAASVAPMLGEAAKGKKAKAKAKAAAAAAKAAAAASGAGAAAAGSEFRPFQLEAERFLTPKDFARIRTIRARLAERGFTDAKARDVLRAMLQTSGAAAAAGAAGRGVVDAAVLPPAVAAILDDGLPSDFEMSDDEGSGKGKRKAKGRGAAAAAAAADSDSESDSDGDDDEAAEGMAEDGAAAAAGGPGSGKKGKAAEEAPKRKRRGGRNLGYASDEEPDASDDDDDSVGDQLAMPGTAFFPPVASVDPRSLEADATRRRRREAQRLATVLEEKQAKYAGKQSGGGTTNKEKARKKNFLMLRKSTAVQLKMKQSLALAQKTVRARLTSKANLEKRKKQKRRRT